MDAAGYTIDYEPQARLLTMRLWGFWSLATLAGYTARLLAATTKLRGQRYAVLSDARDFPVQSSLVSAGFERIARRGAKLHRGRTAIVVGSHLNRMQAQRTVATADTRVFLDFEEARGWLRAAEKAA